MHTLLHSFKHTMPGSISCTRTLWHADWSSWVLKACVLSRRWPRLPPELQLTQFWMSLVAKAVRIRCQPQTFKWNEDRLVFKEYQHQFLQELERESVNFNSSLRFRPFYYLGKKINKTTVCFSPNYFTYSWNTSLFLITAFIELSTQT